MLSSALMVQKAEARGVTDSAPLPLSPAAAATRLVDPSAPPPRAVVRRAPNPTGMDHSRRSVLPGTTRAAGFGGLGSMGGSNFGGFGTSKPLFSFGRNAAAGASAAAAPSASVPATTPTGSGNSGAVDGALLSSSAEQQILAVDSDSDLPQFETELTPEQQKALIRRVTWRIVPFVSFLYFLAFLDRSNIGASHAPLKEDLNMSEDDFASAVGIFFFGYVLFELPSNLILRRVGAHVWLSVMILSWGTVCFSMAFVRDLNGLLTARFFLGVAEGGFFPGILLFLTRWFVDRELASRLVMLSIASSAAGVLGGILGFSFLRMDGLGGLQGWQWLFLLEGLPSMLLGVLVYFYLPADPTRMSGLTAAEVNFLVARIEHQDTINRFKHNRLLAITAAASPNDELPSPTNSGLSMPIAMNQIESADRNGGAAASATPTAGVSGRSHHIRDSSPKVTSWMEVKDTLSDPRILLMAAINLCLITPMYSLSFFMPAIIEQFGYSFLGSNLLSSPVALVAGAFALLNSLHSDATRERFYHIVVPAGFVSLSFFMQAGAMNSGNRGFEFFCLFLNAWSSSVISPCLAMLTSFLHSSTQVAVASALVVSVANAGGYIGPKLFALAFERVGNYWPAMIAMALFELVAVVLLFVLRWYVDRQNQNERAVLSDTDFDAESLKPDAVHTNTNGGGSASADSHLNHSTPATAAAAGGGGVTNAFGGDSSPLPISPLDGSPVAIASPATALSANGSSSDGGGALFPERTSAALAVAALDPEAPVATE